MFPSTQLQHALYGLATFITVLSGLDSLLNPTRRWHQLRSMACSMEATIWMYRARVGRFQQVSSVSRSAIATSNSNSPCILEEIELCLKAEELYYTYVVLAVHL